MPDGARALGLTRAAAALLLALPVAAAPVNGLRERAQPVQPVQLLREAAGSPGAELESEHFHLVYDPKRVTQAQAEEARRLAEQAWARCEKLFGAAPTTKRLRLDLSPDFAGATGFARSGDPNARDEKDRPMVGVRYADLDYLGLSGEYVLTHEIGHIFSGPVASTALGEGVADWAAGSFSGVQLRQWWGPVLRGHGLWIDPEALFVTGEFDSRPEVDEVIRTAQYAESGLLVRFLVDRFGWSKFRAFAEEYGKARGRLNSNEERKHLRPRRDRDGENRRDPRLPPDEAEVRALFLRHFAVAWERLKADWEASTAADKAPAGEAERLVLAEQIYGAIRNWETWALEQKPAPARSAREGVRSAFTRANRALLSGDLEGASRALEDARALVDRLRRPRSVA